MSMLAPLERGAIVSASTPPPPTGGGAKYGLLGLVLVLASVGLYCASKEDPPPPEPVAEVVDAGAPIERSTNPFGPEIEIPEELEDAGTDTAEPEEVAMTTMMSTMRAQRNCDGNLDISAVQRVVAQERRQVRSCYERRLKVNNVLQGTVNVRMIIGSDGSVDQVAVGGSLRDNEVFQCVRQLARRWQFPRPTGDTCAQINAPFTLTPRP